MDSTIFLELDEKMQNTDMALDELLKMKLPNEAKDALNMVIDNLTFAVGLISQIKNDYFVLENTNTKLNQAFQGAKKQLIDIDIEMGE